MTELHDKLLVYFFITRTHGLFNALWSISISHELHKCCRFHTGWLVGGRSMAGSMAAAAAIASLYSEAQVAGGLLVGNSENENHFILLVRGETHSWMEEVH